MFNNLPGRRLSVRGQQCCEFCQSDWVESIQEMVEAGAASDALKARFALGEEWTCDKDATVRIQGETDSFGAEYIYYCDECDNLVTEVNDYFDKKGENEEAQCEWCKKITTQGDLHYTRDIDEGSNGPVYEVCSECRQKQAKEIDEELAGYDY